jgi:hypothetical protein
VSNRNDTKGGSGFLNAFCDNSQFSERCHRHSRIASICLFSLCVINEDQYSIAHPSQRENFSIVILDVVGRKSGTSRSNSGANKNESHLEKALVEPTTSNCCVTEIE